MPLATLRGGAEQTLLHLLDHHSITPPHWTVFFFEDGPMVDHLRAKGVKVLVINAGRLRNPFQFFRTVRTLARFFRQQKIDLVLSWMGKAHLYGGLAALWARCPAVWFQHAFPTDVRWSDRLVNLIPAQGILACSQAGAAQQEALWPSRPTQVVHPGIDLSRFHAAQRPTRVELRRRLNLPLSAPIIGMVGRLQRWKGMHVFIDAIARLREAHPNVRGVIVGGEHDYEPEYPPRLRQQIDRLGLSDAIIMTGFQSDPAAWMSTFDVFVHASDREPFGLVVIEAMALGLPVVASDTAGPTEVITAEEHGLFAPFGDDAELARQIQRYLEAPDWAAEIGRAAHTRAQDFSAPKFADRVVDALRALSAREAQSTPLPAAPSAPTSHVHPDPQTLLLD